MSRKHWPRKSGLGLGLGVGGGGIGYEINDQFLTDATAPITSPRIAEPGPGIVAIRDTENKITIANDYLNFANQATAVYAEEDSIFTPAISRTSGKTVICRWKCTTDNFHYPLVLVTSATPSYKTTNSTTNDTNAHTHVDAGFWRSGATALSVISSAGNNIAAPIIVPAFIADGTTYWLAIVLKTIGARYYIKGGIYTDWTFLYESFSGSASTLYLASAGHTAVYAISPIKTPYGGALKLSEASDNFSLLTETDGMGSIDAISGTLTLLADVTYGARRPRWMTADGKIWSFSATLGVEYSTDGITWTSVIAAPMADVQVGIVSGTGRLIWTTSSGRIYVSDVAKTAWALAVVDGLQPDPSFTYGYTQIGFGYDVYGNKVFLGSYGDKTNTPQPRFVLYSADGGATFTTIYAPGDNASNSTHVHAVAYDPWADRVWISEGDSPHSTILYCDNYGEAVPTWTDIFPGDDNSGIQPTDICATVEGVYFGMDGTNDGYAFWSRAVGVVGPADIIRDQHIISGYNYATTSYATSSRSWANHSTSLYLGVAGAKSTSSGHSHIFVTTDGITFYEIYRGELGGSVRNIVGPDANGKCYGYYTNPSSVDSAYIFQMPSQYYNNVSGATKTWSGSTWTIPNNHAANTPTVAANSLADGNFDNWTTDTNLTNWTESIAGTSTVNKESVVVDTGDTYSVRCDIDGSNSNAQVLSYSTPHISTPAWIRFTVRARADAAGPTASMTVRGVTWTTPALTTAFTTYTMAGKNNNTGDANVILNKSAATSSSLYFAKATMQQLTLNTLFRSISTTLSSFYAQVKPIILKGGFEAGLGLCLDSTSNPQNFIIAYYSKPGAKVVVEECVAGVYTSLISVATPYNPGGYLMVYKNGNTIRAWYGEIYLGAATATANTNTTHGLFSTGNPDEVKFEGFAIQPLSNDQLNSYIN